MKNSKLIGQNIFPDLDDEVIKGIQKLKDEFGVGISFFAGSGDQLEITWPENLTPNCPGDLSLYDSEGICILTFINNFGKIEIYGKEQYEREDGVPFLIIPIFEDDDISMD